ncbi:MAG: dihydroorotate dehydrogenase electron transfer subunit [Coriobacteriia bacterium]|nr:dihydroorotate dehydrogenase electron transfer subunit [Coriobacteriia bacterium]
MEQVIVEANERVATGVGLVALRAPRIAASVQPGQFVHLRIAEGTAFILRRPFSVHRVVGETIEVLYQVVGVGTRWLAERMPGDAMDAVGPLGTGWRVPDGIVHALLVAGGLGAAPLGMLAEHLAGRGVAVTVAQGAPSAERLVGGPLFEQVARRVATATDDGSAGVRGLVTAVVPELLGEDRPDAVFACGPEAMMQAVARHAAGAGIPCQVSLERLMACGVGACLSCTVSTTKGIKRACADGPVFDAGDVVWVQDEVEGLKR